MSQINFSEFVVMPLYVSLIAIFPVRSQLARRDLLGVQLPLGPKPPAASARPFKLCP